MVMKLRKDMLLIEKREKVVSIFRNLLSALLINFIIPLGVMCVLYFYLKWVL